MTTAVRIEGDLKTFGGRVQAVRQARGWTQGDLASRLGVTQAQVSWWECFGAEKRGCSFFLGIRLAQALGVSPVWLATGEGKP